MADIPDPTVTSEQSQHIELDPGPSPGLSNAGDATTEPEDEEVVEVVQSAPPNVSQGPVRQLKVGHSWWMQPTGAIKEMYLLDSRQPRLKIHVTSVDQGDGNTAWQVDIFWLALYSGPPIILCWLTQDCWNETVYGDKHPHQSSGPVVSSALRSAKQPPRTFEDLISDDSLQDLAQALLDDQYHPVDHTLDFNPQKKARKMRLRAPESPFSMMEAFNDNHDLLLLLVSWLDIPTLISLYAIDRRFHFIFNCNPVAYITTSMRTWARGSELIFPWRAYRKLCIADPMPRVASKWQGKEHLARKKHEIRRSVPGLKWLQMVCYREAIAKDILVQLALQNLRCPPGTSDAIKRMWYMLDMPLNRMRITLIHSDSYFTNTTLENLTCFFLKLDMFFTDAAGLMFWHHPDVRRYPEDMVGMVPLGSEMREYLLHARQLTPLWRVLHGWSPDPTHPQLPMNRIDLMRMWVRHKFRPPADALEDVKKMSVLGVPWTQHGTQRLERSYVPIEQYKPKTMLRPDELVMLEGMRRKLSMHQRWVQLMLYGIWNAVGLSFPELTEEEMCERLLASKIGT